MQWLREYEDAAVVRRVLAGDTTAFEAFVRRYTRAAYAVAFSHVRNRSDVEEIAQEAFLQAFLGLPRLREPSRFRSWFLSIVRNLSINHAKKHWRETELVEDESHAMNDLRREIEERERSRVLESQLRALSAEDREVLTLHYYARMNTAEIGASLGQSREAVKKRLQRARARFGAEALVVLFIPLGRGEAVLQARVVGALRRQAAVPSVSGAPAHPFPPSGFARVLVRLLPTTSATLVRLVVLAAALAVLVAILVSQAFRSADMPFDDKSGDETSRKPSAREPAMQRPAGPQTGAAGQGALQPRRQGASEPPRTKGGGKGFSK